MRTSNILIISENDCSIKKIRAALGEDNNITICQKLEQALELQKNSDYELIITDMTAQENEINNFFKKSMELHKELGAVIALTENINEKVLLESDNIPEIFYTLKAWDEDTLKIAVKNALGAYLIAKENRYLIEKLKESYSKTLIMLANALEARDAYAQGHSERVAYTAKCIAKRLNIADKDIELLYSACLLHDIGKIGVPENILHKTDTLDEDDMIYIKAHTSIAERILSPNPEFAEMLHFIRAHHERVDGKGYPDGLKGDEIPLFSRIMAVADTFDAITSARPYREGKSFDEAIKILQEVKGTQLDSAIVDLFIKMLTEKEIYSVWELE